MAKIKARINPLSSNEIELEYNSNYKIQDYFDELIKEVPSREIAQDYFKAFVNGVEIDRDFWPYTKPKENCDVLIALVPQGGNFGQVFKQVAIIAVIAVVSAYTGGAAAAGTMSLGAAIGINTAAAIGASLLFNALIPPPDSSQSFGGGGPDGLESSQMYSISGQSNTMKKYGVVPKVYGQHRMFPNIAANAYTSIESDSVTGDLVQYFYAIYDFGFGPMDIKNIQLGDTPIENYNDISYRLVDINKPLVSEGYWDDQLENSFEIYKGDITQTAVNVNLNGNQQDAGAIEAEYLAIRNVSTNQAESKQEIVTTVAFGGGLNSYSPAAQSGERRVDVKLEFAVVGTEDWRNFDDLAYVDKFESTILSATEVFMPAASWNDSLSDGIGLVNTEFYDWFLNREGLETDYLAPDGFAFKDFKAYFQTPVGGYTHSKSNYGIIAGQTTRLPLNIQVPVGREITLDDVVIGTVTGHSVNAVSGGWWNNITPAKFTRVLFWEVTRTSNATPDELYWTEYKGYGDSWPFNEMGSTISRLKSRGGAAGVNTFFGQQDTALFGTFRFSPKSTESLKLRMTRIRSYDGFTFRISENMTWVSLTTRFERLPIVTDKRHVFMEIRIKATDQLSGAIKNLSAICTSVLDVYNPNTLTWSKAPTKNPAWIFADILTGEINKKAILKTRLDTSTLVAWANYADEVPTAPSNMDAYTFPRFECSFVMDYKATVQQLLDQVTSSAQASLNIVDGKYGVLIDRAVTTPVQVLTPRNYFNFSSNRKYTEIPDGLKIKFVNPGSNWEVKEQIVFNDGEDEDTAIEFEEFEVFGITNWEQAWRYGRYMLAQAILRQETITVYVDFEHLVCTRGDYVLLTSDVMKVGGVPARIKAVDGVEVTIDNPFSTIPLVNYGYTYRSRTGTFHTSTMTITTPTTADLDGAIPQIGDLIIWGEVAKITFECIVKAILPASDLSAQLVLVEKNNAIFDSETSQEIPGYDPLLSSVLDEDLTAPLPIENLVVTDNTFDCNGAQYIYFVSLVWDIPLGTIYETFEVYTDNGTGFVLDGFTSVAKYKYIVDPDFLDVEHKFKVLAVSANGAKISIGEAIEVVATPSNKTAPPSNVDDLYINITNETLTLDWDKVEDCDIANYQIRYSPNLSATWEKSVELTTVDPNTSSTSVQARTGSYYIKAIDFNGNQSDVAASAVTSIPDLVNLNVIAETNDFPAFPGVKDKVVVQNNALLLEEEIGGIPPKYRPEGEYLYENILDNGEIYTVRLQSLIDAEGYTVGDVMANWVTLASVVTLSTVSVGEWNVETYYRGRDTLSVIANWVTMAGIVTMSAGEEGEWTNWRKFTIGDFTARYFQFKLKLISIKESVSPRVFDAKIKADMPDRVEDVNNVVAPSGGYRVNYAPAFKGPGTTPSVGITIDGASSGDYWAFTNRDLTGFDIQFFDKNNVAVSRQFDALIKGFGRKQTATI